MKKFIKLTPMTADAIFEISLYWKFDTHYLTLWVVFFGYGLSLDIKEIGDTDEKEK